MHYTWTVYLRLFYIQVLYLKGTLSNDSCISMDCSAHINELMHVKKRVIKVTLPMIYNDE